MVSPAVQGQVRHPSIVPEFLRFPSCGMTSARGHGAIVYCLNSGREDRQTGLHNMLCEGDTKNRWRDGQVCPDVGQETMAPWARRLGRGKDGSERGGEEKKKSGENGRRKRRERRRKKESRGERERSPPCMEKRAESGNWSEKDDERRWR
ncbi:hypothetical protein TNCV_4914591 [Trichonephila clavipes]|nr:hypothetical protein TNCV_4914591 [Trichonephila clavipes]